MATTPNRGYQLPAPGSKLKDDVLRLIAALGAIDTDVANLLLALAGKSDLGHGHAMAEITGLVAALGNKLDVGYHDALANLTDVDVAGVANGMALLRQASKWIPVALQINNIAGLETALSSKATPADIAAAINALVAAAPGALDTLNELATALGNDPDFAATVSTALGNRVRVDDAQSLSDGQKAQARANIGAISSEPTTRILFEDQLDLIQIARGGKSYMLGIASDGRLFLYNQTDAIDVFNYSTWGQFSFAGGFRSVRRGINIWGGGLGNGGYSDWLVPASCVVTGITHEPSPSNAYNRLLVALWYSPIQQQGSDGVWYNIAQAT